MKIASLFLGIAALGIGGTAGVVVSQPQTDVVVEAPVASLEDENLIRISELLSENPRDAVLLSKLYNSIADILERDDAVVKTLGQVREANSRSGRLLFQKTGMQGKYDGLPDAVDSFIQSKLGDTDVILTPELRAKTVKAFSELSQACTFGIR